MTPTLPPAGTCWCGQNPLDDFSPDYLRCPRCQTLVLRNMLGPEIAHVRNEDTDLYGRNYYLEHLVNDYNFPELPVRMRRDLPERCLHWLKTLRKYKLPAAKVLELGCGHGASVALYRAAGYDASGLEISPWLAGFVSTTWGVPMLAGPIEDQKIAPGSLDAILLFDVLEHLRSPLATMQHCAKLLRPDGILFVQTPRYPENVSFAELEARKDRFLDHFKPMEHLFLFSNTSARLIMEKAGLPAVAFEDAIFSHYDQSFVAARETPLAIPPETADAKLHSTPSGRLVGALVDLQADAARIAEHAAGAAPVVAERNRQIAELTSLLKHSQTESSARHEQILELTRLVKMLESDTVARSEQISQLTQLATTAQQAGGVHQAQIKDLAALLAARDETIRTMLGQIDTLTGLARDTQADALARAKQIDVLGSILTEREKTIAIASAQITTLTDLARSHEAGASARSAQVEELTKLAQDSQSDALARSQQIDELSRLLGEREKAAAIAAAQISALTELARSHEASSAARAAQVDALTALVRDSQTDGLARARQIDTLTALVSEKDRSMVSAIEQIGALQNLLRAREQDAQARSEQVTQLTRLAQDAQADISARTTQIHELTQLIATISQDQQQQHEQVASFATWLKQRDAEYQQVVEAHHAAEKTVAYLQSQLRAQT